MNELNNTAEAIGSYNNIPTSLTSNTSVVNMVEGLTLTKEADKKNWTGGQLTYIITLDNQTDKDYVQPIITDTIDTNLVNFVPGSVTIDGIVAEASKYNYDDATHTLTVNLDDVTATSSTTLTFCIEKNT